MEFLVAGGNITGQVHNPANVVSVTGKVDGDGNGSLTVANVSAATLHMTGDHFDAEWQNRECVRHAEGSRENAGQEAALTAERKQYQDRFADLSRRAGTGDKTVDYAALRAAYVYSETWDFYNARLPELMQQAYAAQKGGDCATALADIDQVLHMNFTVSEAHSLRGECLKETDRDQSRIESRIADGLSNSVLDSGDGDNEKTAYVVNTMDEENLALIHRHLQIKARQTEIRGTDGHYYDMIQAIGLSGGVRVRAVYFDVSSFAKGRESKRAAAALAAANIH